MALIKTQKHELEYDDMTGQFVFNGGRNVTPNLRVHDPLPSRLVTYDSNQQPEE